MDLSGYNSQDSQENEQDQTAEIRDLEPQEIRDLEEIQQSIAWNKYISLESFPVKKVVGQVDEFQLKSIQKLASLRAKGLRFNDQLVNTKAFKNPGIMEKMLEYHNVNSHGSFILVDDSFEKVYIELQSFNANASSKPLKENKKSIEFVKSSHKSYDKRRRI